MATQTPTSHHHDDSWSRVPSSPSTPAHFIFVNAIEKSDKDSRKFKLIRLGNGLQALLIHDTKADRASVCLNIAVGHMHDPDDMRGLAHLLDCIWTNDLFPTETSTKYKEFLSEHSGGNHLNVGASDTRFGFSVDADALRGALQHFYAYIHSTVISPSPTTLAINIAYLKFHLDYAWEPRPQAQLERHLAKPRQPWRRFVTGYNINSASDTDSGGEDEAVGLEMRRGLMERWSKECCAGRMGLCLIGKQSLDELTELAVNHFSPIQNHEQSTALPIPSHPFGPEGSGTIVNLKRNTTMLEVHFPLSWQVPLWRRQMWLFLWYFAIHKGPGSLQRYLERKGWVWQMVANTGDGDTVFKVIMMLTKDGFENCRTVLLVCYKYFSLLRASSQLPEYHEELRALLWARFRFPSTWQRHDDADRFAGLLTLRTAREQFLTSSEVAWEWDASAVHNALTRLTVEHSRVILSAPDFTAVKGVTGPWQVEPWHGTEYRVKKFDQEFAAMASAPNDIPELFLPRRNEFIARNLDVEKQDIVRPLERPLCVWKTPLCALWHKRDDRFWEPKAATMIKIQSPLPHVSVLNAVMLDLYRDLLNDVLDEYTYEINLAGACWSVASGLAEMFICVDGFNDRHAVIVRRVLEKVNNLRVAPDRLEFVKEQARINYKQREWCPETLAEETTDQVFRKHWWTSSERLAVLADITVEALECFISDFHSGLKIDILITGNVYKEDAIAIAQMIEDIIRARPLLATEVPHRLSLILPQSCNYVYDAYGPELDKSEEGTFVSVSARSLIASWKCASLLYVCQVGEDTDARLWAIVSVLAHIISEPLRDVLPKDARAGFKVDSNTLMGSGLVSYRITLVSAKDPTYMETRLEALLAGMRDILESMTDTQFEEHLRELIKASRENLKHENVVDEASMFFDLLQEGYYDFMQFEPEAALIQATTRAEVLAIYERYIEPSSAARSKLSVHQRPRRPPPRHFFGRRDLYPEVPDAMWRNRALWASAILGGAAGAPPPASAAFLRRATALLMETLEKFEEKYPGPPDGRVALRDDTEFVEDVQAFKARLRVSDPPRPVEDFDDLIADLA